MTDLQAEIDSKEKCQEQLNIIYANAQTLLGDTKKYTKEHLAELESQYSSSPTIGSSNSMAWTVATEFYNWVGVEILAHHT